MSNGNSHARWMYVLMPCQETLDSFGGLTGTHGGDSYRARALSHVLGCWCPVAICFCTWGWMPLRYHPSRGLLPEGGWGCVS